MNIIFNELPVMYYLLAACDIGFSSSSDCLTFCEVIVSNASVIVEYKNGT